MNGQLSDQPLPELIREISEKGFSGTLRIEQERLKALIYFQNGTLVYAASNIKNLRLREYLIARELISADELSRFGEQRPDLELAKALLSAGRTQSVDLDAIQARQVSDVLRLAMTWTAGKWEFDSRFHLQEQISLKLELPTLLLEGSRQIAKDFVASRFRNPVEMISPTNITRELNNLLPEEGFLLSRIERPMGLPELVALSGQDRQSALRLTYSLALAGLLQRERWNNAFRSNPQPSVPRKEQPSAKPSETFPVTEQQPSVENNPAADMEKFLDGVSKALNHYAVLGVTDTSTTQEIKTAYYSLARRYHPDHFRQSTDNALKTRIETAFARITQAYDALSDPSLRAAYDSKLESLNRARDLANAAPKAPEPTASNESSSNQAPADESTNKILEFAEEQFKEGFGALQVGQLNVALGLLSAAARAVPNESRYRAYYGQALSKNSNMRRLAESELQAAIKLNPANADYRTMLAELYVALGFPVRARSELERALSRDPGHQKAKELLRNLKPAG